MSWLAATLMLAGCVTTGGGGAAKVALPLRDSGILAGPLGAGLAEAALNRAAEAEYRALEAGQTGAPVQWKTSEAAFGSVVPQQPYSVGPVNCRRYTHTISTGGDVRTATGTACRQDDGAWRPLS